MLISFLDFQAAHTQTGWPFDPEQRSSDVRRCQWAHTPVGFRLAIDFSDCSD